MAVLEACHCICWPLPSPNTQFQLGDDGYRLACIVASLQYGSFWWRRFDLADLSSLRFDLADLCRLCNSTLLICCLCDSTLRICCLCNSTLRICRLCDSTWRICRLCDLTLRICCLCDSTLWNLCLWSGCAIGSSDTTEYYRRKRILF
jgi:hypothetical protein